MKLTYSKMVAHYLDNVVLKTVCEAELRFNSSTSFGER